MLVEIVDGIESLWEIIAQVAQDFTHVSPVFLLDMGVVVFFIRASTSELDLFLITESFEVVVNELRAESIPKSLKGKACSICFIALSTPAWPLPITARVSTQVV